MAKPEMNGTQRAEASPRAGSHLLRAVVCASALTLLSASALAAISKDQAKRIYDRIAGVPATDAQLTTMAAGSASAAAILATHDPAFYNNTIRNLATPWTNRTQTVFAPLNDYTATVIGMVRDDVPVQHPAERGHSLYSGRALPTSRPTRPRTTICIEALDTDGADLSVHLVKTTQSALTGLPAAATAGVMTTRAAANAFFMDGTNRRMYRFTMMNHLCADLQTIPDTTRPPDRIRQDVTRSPGGDSSLFLNNCIECHSGMDPMAQAFAYYNYSYDVTTDPNGDAGKIVYTAGQVQPKYFINNNNFPQGFVTPDDSWANRMRGGVNSLLGWDPKQSGSGNGAKSLGMELEGSDAFANCQVVAGVQVCVLPRAEQCGRPQPGRHDDQHRSSPATRCGKSSLMQPSTAWGIDHELHTHDHLAHRQPCSFVAASAALTACSGGAPTTATAATAPTSSANAYTGPAPATADVQAFAVNFWANVRVQNRCGQCHNATSPAQMPNFARSDDVNLAYAQANTVVNLQQPSTSRIVTKVSGGHNCWLADPNACGEILTTWISNWAGASGGGTGTQVQLVAPPPQNVGSSKNFPGSPDGFPNDGVPAAHAVLLQVPRAGRGHPAIAVLRVLGHQSGLSVRHSEDEFEHAEQFALRQPAGGRHAQLLGGVRYGQR